MARRLLKDVIIPRMNEVQQLAVLPEQTARKVIDVE
jgi:hypothetical protein